MTREELKKYDKDELIELILALVAKVSELEARINMNSKNRSKPPSSDGFRKPKSLRTASGKKSGGQEGHEGSGLRMMREPDKIIIHEPEECVGCAMADECRPNQEVKGTRYEIDIHIDTTITAHRASSVVCPRKKTLLQGVYPSNITGTMQYGANIEALAVSLNTVGTVSVNRTHEILNGVFGVPLSNGTISNMVSECAEMVAPSVEEIKEAISQEPLIHNDETGTRVDKKTVWAHVASTDKLTYIGVHEKRGKTGMNAIGIVLLFLGTMIHGCWASYFSYQLARQGLCVAHLLRELTAVWENTKQGWAQKLIDLLLGMKKTKETLILQGKSTAPPEVIEKYSREYDTILGVALAQNPIPAKEGGRKPKRGKTGALVDRLILRKDQYPLFFKDFDVPFDNNQAERDIRMFKVKQKVSGCFRTLNGAKDFATISSYIGTAHKNGIPAYQALRNAILGKPFSVLSQTTE